MRGQVISVPDLLPETRGEMFRLMCSCYANVRRDIFEQDLSEKPWVILLLEDTGEKVCGFSTQMLLELHVDQSPARILFSGDTIVHPMHRGESLLAGIWGQFALNLIDSTDDRALYWFLTTKGYRTYRFLPLFFREFYPCYERATPASISRLRDCLGQRRYPAQYDPRSGVIRGSRDGYFVNDEGDRVTKGRLRDPHVRFFVEQNPGHLQGDELCCLAPLTRENFTPAAFRAIRRTHTMELEGR